MWLADVDGTRAPYPLTAGEHGDADPAWSPDGTRPVFTRGDGEGGGSLRVVPVDGPGETVTVCARPDAVEAPAIDDHGDVHVYRVGPDGDPQRVLGGTRTVTGLSRSGSPRHRIQRAEMILDFFGGRRPDISWTGRAPSAASRCR